MRYAIGLVSSLLVGIDAAMNIYPESLAEATASGTKKCIAQSFRFVDGQVILPFPWEYVVQDSSAFSCICHGNIVSGCINLHCKAVKLQPFVSCSHESYLRNSFSQNYVVLLSSVQQEGLGRTGCLSSVCTFWSIRSFVLNGASQCFYTSAVWPGFYIET